VNIPEMDEREWELVQQQLTMLGEIGNELRICCSTASPCHCEAITMVDRRVGMSWRFGTQERQP
jgi:hypothetical protein